MRQTLRFVATIGVLGALLGVAPRAATAEEYQGRWFGGVDAGVMQPLNALDRYVQTGGSLAPFVGYKFFDDKDLQLNLGLMGELQLIGATPLIHGDQSRKRAGDQAIGRGLSRAECGWDVDFVVGRRLSVGG